MKIIVTGGHLSPLISFIQAAAKKHEICVIGRRHAMEGDKGISLEYQMLEREKIPFIPLITGRLQRKFTLYTLISLLKLPYGFLQALAILKKQKPDVILTFGGYISLPVDFAAFFLGIPVVIHEQTLGAGLANRIVSIFARKICISWESSYQYFPKEKTVLTGNFLRREILTKQSVKDFPAIKNSPHPLIYITGGSTGAHAINILIEGCIEKLLDMYSVVHQSGDAKQYGDFDRLNKMGDALETKKKAKYILQKFLDSKEIAFLLQNADLVVSRSGINSVTEFLYSGIPALLIPLPFSQKEEQKNNAIFLKELGLGEVVSQEITPDSFYQKITEMVIHNTKYKNHAQKAGAVVNENAVQKCLDVVELI